MPFNLAVKTIRITGTDDTPNDAENQKIFDSIHWEDVEDVLNDQLPEGFYAKVED